MKLITKQISNPAKRKEFLQLRVDISKMGTGQEPQVNQWIMMRIFYKDSCLLITQHQTDKVTTIITLNITGVVSLSERDLALHMHKKLQLNKMQSKIIMGMTSIANQMKIVTMEGRC